MQYWRSSSTWTLRSCVGHTDEHGTPHEGNQASRPLVAPLRSTPKASRGKNVRLRGPRRRRPAATARPPPPAPPPPRELRPGRGLARWRVPEKEGRCRGRRLGRPCRRAPPRQTGWPRVNCSSCIRVLVSVATMCNFTNYNLF